MLLSVIIPAFNEAETIRQIVKDWSLDKLLVKMT